MTFARLLTMLTTAILPLLASGCGSGWKLAGIEPAICSELARPIDRLNGAVLQEGVPDDVVLAADAVTIGFDAGCAR